MKWKDHSNDFGDEEHAFLSPSQYSWVNYTNEHLVEVRLSKLASIRGTAFHDLAQRHILLREPMPKKERTLNLYVNDCIKHKMHPEVKLYYSKFCFGKADALSFDTNSDGVLRIYDLKTGKIKASFMQLKIYAALFILDQLDGILESISKIILRIYQFDTFEEEEPDLNEISEIMSKIVIFNKLLYELETEYDAGSETYWCGS